MTLCSVFISLTLPNPSGQLNPTWLHDLFSNIKINLSVWTLPCSALFLFSISSCVYHLCCTRTTTYNSRGKEKWKNKKKTESDVILWVSSKIIKSWKHFGAVFGAVVIKADATHLSEKDKVILTDYPLPRGGKER